MTGKTISWFGEKGRAGAEVTKTAGQAIVGITSVVIVGAVLGTATKLFGGK